MIDTDERYDAPRRRPGSILAAMADGRIDIPETDTRLGAISSAVHAAGGHVLSVSGQSLMAEFDTADEAFSCALRIQSASDHPAGVRIGIAAHRAKTQANAAVVILAQALRGVAPPGGIALTEGLYAELAYTMPVAAVPMLRPLALETGDPVPVVTISAEACEAWAGSNLPPRDAVLADDRISLAIVPFRATTSQVSGFAEAVTEDVIRIVGGAARYIGVTRAPVVSPWGPVDLRQIRQTCNARYLLHGAADRERGSLRLTVELNEAATGRVLWSDGFENANGETSVLRDVCAPRIAGEVTPALIQRELERTGQKPAATLSAREMALRAMAAIMQPEREPFRQAGEALQAARNGPDSAGILHYASVAWHLMAIAQGWSADPPADGRRAIELAQRLDRDDAASLAMLAYVQGLLRRNHGLSLTMLDRVIDRSPFSPMPWSMKARVLIQMGEGHEAVLHAEQAEMLPSLGFDRAWRGTITAAAYYADERYAEAAHWARIAAVHHPGLAVTARVLAASLVVLGQLDEAQQAAARVLAIDPGFRISSWRLRSMFTAELRERYAQRLRLAGLPE